MTHAFAWLPSPYRWALLVVLIAGTVILAARLTSQGKPLITEAAPNGILSYEFAWNQSKAGLILDSWKLLKETARWQLILDFAFLVFYPLAISLACAMLANSPHNKMAVAGIFISWAVLASGFLDAAENIALLRMLDLGASDFLAQLAAWCAGVKFTLVFAGLGYVVLQGLAVLAAKIRGA